VKSGRRSFCIKFGFHSGISIVTLFGASVSHDMVDDESTTYWALSQKPTP
jgi:hypothetical protein